MALTQLDSNTALVVVDLQRGIVAAPAVLHTGAEVVERSRELAQAFRKYGLPVVLVNVEFGEDFAAAPKGRNELSGGAGTPPEGWTVIADELDAQPGDIRVTKHQWGAFHDTALDAQLRRRGITQIVLAGLVTSIGIDTTAREAWARNYHVTFATDAMADRELPSHEHSLGRIFPRLGESGTTAEILELLEKTRA